MYGQILAPVDFSDISANALRHAARLAQCGAARVTALFADPFTPPPYFTEARVAALAGEYRQAMADAQERLRAFVREHAPGVAVETAVLELMPVDAIVAAIADFHAGLVVMGTHGRSGFNRLMLGSVAENTLRASSVPVLTVGARHARPEIGSILVPVDEPEAARAALSEASQVALCTGASLTLLHVAGERGAAPDYCEWLPTAARQRCQVRQVTVTGDPAERIVETAEALGSDLVVLAPRRRAFAGSPVLGATAARVVRHAPCAVLTAIHRTASESRAAHRD